MRRCCSLPLLSLLLVLSPGQLLSQQNVERQVLGTVVSINAERSLITVRPSNLWGKFLLNLSDYHVKQPMLLNGLRSGDRISATYFTSDGMLHRLRRICNYQVYQETSKLKR